MHFSVEPHFNAISDNANQLFTIFFETAASFSGLSLKVVYIVDVSKVLQNRNV